MALVLSAGRVAVITPDLFGHWRLPTRADLRPLVVNGGGVWLGGLGWQMLAASNGLVITYLGNPE